MNKILEGAREALAFAQGTGQTAAITASVGGPYVQGGQRTLTQVEWPHGGYIVWNWDLARWDRVAEPVRVISLPNGHCEGEAK